MEVIEKYLSAVEIVDDELIEYEYNALTKEVLYETIGILNKVDAAYADAICLALSIDKDRLEELGVDVVDSI